MEKFDVIRGLRKMLMKESEEARYLPRTGYEHVENCKVLSAAIEKLEELDESCKENQEEN